MSQGVGNLRGVVETRLILVQHGPAARQALWEVVDAVKHGDPLAPVTVAVPSPHAGLALRRGFAGGGRAGFAGGGRAGFANVRFMALARIAELLGAPALAASGRRPLTGPLRSHAVRTALGSVPGPLSRVRHHPATARAVERSVLDLRRAGPEARARVAGRSGRAAAMVALADRYAELTAPYFDDDDLLAAAAAAVDSGIAALADVGTVAVHLPLDLSPAEQRLVGALARAGRAAAIIGITGDPRADRAAHDMAARLEPYLGAPDARQDAGLPIASRVVHAPDPDDEVRAVVRSIGALAAHSPLHRVAVLYRLQEPYARLLRSNLDTAGIVWNGPSGRRLADCVAGRVLTGLLELAAGDLTRDAVTGWLATGPVLDPSDGGEVPAHRFDRLSREAGVIAGLDQWTDRLSRLAEERESTLADEEEAGDAPESRLRRLRSDAADAPRVAAFVTSLAEKLAPPDPPSWAAFVSWALALLESYLGSARRRAAWPVAEIEAAERVEAAIEGLAVLSEVDPAVDADRFRQAVERELEAPAARHGRFGEGVFAGPLGQAYAGDFDTVFVLGLAEGTFPPRGSEDPLLPDRERAAAGDSLPQQAHRRVQERRDFLAALASAPTRVLSFPRADPRSERPQLPARWLVESAAALAGEPLGAEALLERAGGDWLGPVASFEAGVLESTAPGGEPASAAEHDLGWLRRWQQAGRPMAEHPLLAASPALAAGLACAAARFSPRLTPFDGLVGARPDLAPSGDRPISPTALQYWASCPRRYLFEQILRVRELERPEATETIAATERGTLVHDVLERFVSEHTPAEPTYRWTDADRAELLAIARERCDDAEAHGLTGRPLRWKVERRRIELIVLATLDDDEAIRARLGDDPGAFEEAFGVDGGGPAAQVDLGDGRTLAFKGRIDRIDASPGGDRVVVFDYKTGRGSTYSALDGDPVDGGRRLQLPVYAAAAARSRPGAEIHSYFWFVEERGSGVWRGYEVDGPRQERFVEVVRAIVDGIESGVFPAAGKPGRDGDALEGCTWCAYQRACPPGRARAWSRKQADPAAAPYLRLSLPDATSKPARRSPR